MENKIELKLLEIRTQGISKHKRLHKAQATKARQHETAVAYILLTKET
jgi:hypothetical protein